MKSLLLISAALLASCAPAKQVAVETCEVAKPAYGNDLASCLIVWGKWKPRDASVAGEWYRQTVAFSSSVDSALVASTASDTGRVRHIIRAYTATSRALLASAGIDSAWVGHRLAAESASAASLDSSVHADLAAKQQAGTLKAEYTQWFLRRMNDCEELGTGFQVNCMDEWKGKWPTLSKLPLDRLQRYERALRDCYQQSRQGYVAERMADCDAKVSP